MSDKFAKFTERARKVLSLAQEEAQRFNHNYIGTEHLLLGLIREGDGVAAKVLAGLGVELNKVHSAFEQVAGRRDRIVLGEIGLTPRAKKAIELAVDEARRLNHHYIGTEHLLLGLMRSNDETLAAMLKILGVNPDTVRVDTVQVLKILSWAQEEAQRFNHNYIGTEHLLLGLLREGDGGAAKVLNNLGVELNKVRSVVEQIVGRGDRIVLGEIGLTPRAKGVIELALDEADHLGHKYIGTEHLLLGLIREGEGIAAGVLESLGVTLEKARSEMLRMLGEPPGTEGPAPDQG